MIKHEIGRIRAYEIFTKKLFFKVFDHAENGLFSKAFDWRQQFSHFDQPNFFQSADTYAIAWH